MPRLDLIRDDKTCDCPVVEGGEKAHLWDCSFDGGKYFSFRGGSVTVLVGPAWWSETPDYFFFH